VGAFIVAALYAASRIAHQYLNTLYASEIRLVALLHTEVAGVVAGRIIAVAVDVGLRHLAYVAENISGRWLLVLAQDTLLNEETGEAVQLLLKAPIVLRGKLRHKALWRVRRVSGVQTLILDVDKALFELLGSDIESIAEVDCIERLHIAGDEHHVVGRLIEYHQLTVTVVYESARGVDGLFKERV